MALGGIQNWPLDGLKIRWRRFSLRILGAIQSRPLDLASNGRLRLNSKVKKRFFLLAVGSSQDLVAHKAHICEKGRLLITALRWDTNPMVQIHLDGKRTAFNVLPQIALDLRVQKPHDFKSHEIFFVFTCHLLSPTYSNPSHTSITSKAQGCFFLSP